MYYENQLLVSTVAENQPVSQPVDPEKVIEQFFELAHLHEIKEMLSDIKEQLINKSYPHEPGSIDFDNTIYFFEKLNRLIEANHQMSF